MELVPITEAFPRETIPDYIHNSVIKVYHTPSMTKEAVLPMTKPVVDQYLELIARYTRLYGPFTVDQLWLEWSGPILDRYVKVGNKEARLEWIKILNKEMDLSRYAKTLNYTFPPPYISEVILNGSLVALDHIQSTILGNQHYHLGLGQLYAIIKVLGAGVSGTAFGLRVRTLEVDSKIIEMLNRITPTWEGGLKELTTYLDTLKPVLAVKVSKERDWRTSLTEFTIARQMAAVLLPLGLRSVPVAYSVGVVPRDLQGMFIYSTVRGQSYSPSDFYRTAGEIVNKARLESGKVDELMNQTGVGMGDVFSILESDDILTYQEYIDGITMNQAVRRGIDIVQFNGILCYLHGLLSYLYKKLEFIHNDLHYGNIILRKHDRPVSLPILSSSGSIVTYIRLNATPVILDMGSSQTKFTMIPSMVSGPLKTAISDIITLTEPYMYEALSAGKIERDMVPSYLYTRETLLQNGDLDLAGINTHFTGPYLQFKSEGILTHDSVVDAIIRSGAINSLFVGPPPKATYQDMGLYSYTEGDSGPLLEEALRCKVKYEGLVREKTDKGEYPLMENAALDFIKGTISFHTRVRR
jgi:hypothetical protein